MSLSKSQTDNSNEPSNFLPWGDQIRALAQDAKRKYGEIPSTDGIVYIFTPTLVFKDAVSRNVIEEFTFFKELCKVKLVFEQAFDGIEKLGTTLEAAFDNFDSSKDSVVYHYSIGTPSLRLLRDWPGRKHAHYHGITPPAMLREVSQITAEFCQKGLDEIGLLDNFASISSTSKFNSKDITEKTHFELSDISILPPFLSLDKWDSINAETPPIMSKNSGEFLLYVGRRAPNKNILGLVDVAAELNRKGHPIRVVIAGGGVFPLYQEQILAKLDALGITEAFDFIDNPSDEYLKWLYLNSKAVVTMSEHEGFCVPLVEAMKFKKPIFAANSSAIAETLKGAGTLLPLSDPTRTSELIIQNLTPGAIATNLARSQKVYEELYSDKVLAKSYYVYCKSVVPRGEYR